MRVWLGKIVREPAESKRALESRAAGSMRQWRTVLQSPRESEATLNRESSHAPASWKLALGAIDGYH